MGHLPSNPKKTVKPIRFIRATVVTAITCVVVNNFYIWFYTHILSGTFTSEAKWYITTTNITILSVGSALLAGIGYFILSKMMRKPSKTYALIVLIFFLLSLYYPISSQLPDGTLKRAPTDFIWLSVPMNVITALLILTMLPSNVNKNKEFEQ
jgi:mannose/fructose/N-acetylgalactosamine-specific phosphotransferase system component IIC